MDNQSLGDTIAPKSDQTNYDDLITGPITVIITSVSRGSKDQPVSIGLDGGRQPYKPCKSMRRALIKAWGDNGSEWVGRSLTLYGDPSVKFGGVAVGGIRISHMSHLNGRFCMMLTTTRSRRSEYCVDALVVADHSKVITEYKASTPEGKETMWATLTPDQQVAVRAAMEA